MTCMNFDIKAFRADCFDLSALEVGAYTLILHEMYLSRDGWISETDLPKIARVARQHWRSVRQALDKFLIVKGGRVTQKRIQRDRHQLGAPTARTDCKNGQEHIESNPLTLRLPSKSEKSESLVSRSDERSKPKRQFPDGWRLSMQDEQYAIERGLIYADEFEAFRDHHIAKGSRFSEWSAAWRTWCRNAVKFKRREEARSRNIVRRNGGDNGKRSLSDAADKLVQWADERAENNSGGESVFEFLSARPVR